MKAVVTLVQSEFPNIILIKKIIIICVTNNLEGSKSKSLAELLFFLSKENEYYLVLYKACLLHTCMPFPKY